MRKFLSYKDQVFRVRISIIILFIHIILLFQSKFINNFNEKSMGGAIVSILLLFFYSLLLNPNFFPKHRFSIFQKFQSTILHNFQKFYKLFLLFAISITAFGVLIRIIIIKLVPLGVQIADMLPLIQKASEVFLNGQNPYKFYFIPYKLPLTFWPGLWLPYSFASILNIDPRWIGLLFWIIISIIVISYSSKKSQLYQSPLLLIIGCVNILLFQVSFSFVSFQGYGHTFPLWLWFILLSIVVIEKKHLLSAVLLGLALSGRQTAIIFIPIFFIYWYHQKNLISSIKYLIVSSFVFGSITLPFIISSPQQFFIEPIQHYSELGRYAMVSEEVHWVKNSIGFSYIIQRTFGSNVLSLFSYLSILGITIISFFLVKTPQKLLIYLAASVTFFSFFTPIPWNYEYFPPLFFLFLAIFCE